MAYLLLLLEWIQGTLLDDLVGKLVHEGKAPTGQFYTTVQEGATALISLPLVAGLQAVVNPKREQFDTLSCFAISAGY